MHNVVFASYITLNTTVTSKVEGNILKVLVKVVNQGDESAYNVQAEVRVGHEKVLASRDNELGVNGVYLAQIKIPLQLKTPGAYPFILTMHYSDANQYPFSALTCQPFYYKAGASPADLFTGLKSVAFWKKGKLALRLKNISQSTLEIRAALIAPRELTVVNGVQLVEVKDKAEQQIVFEMKNFSALDGSTYQVFALAEYDQGGLHCTNITPGTVGIVAEKNLFGLDYKIILAILILLLTAFFSAQVIRKSR